MIRLRVKQPSLKAQDWVRIRTDNHRNKLSSFWSKPLKVERWLGLATFKLLDGFRWHANRLRKVHLPVGYPFLTCLSTTHYGHE